MKTPERNEYKMFGGTFVLANKLQFVGDKTVEGLSTKQWFLTRSILDMPAEPPPTITQIARETDSTRQNVTKMLEKMERGGIVTLEDDALDRRSRCVRITPLGLSLVRKTSENGQDFLKRLYMGINPDDLETAGRVLIKMLENLTKIQEDLK